MSKPADRPAERAGEVDKKYVRLYDAIGFALRLAYDAGRSGHTDWPTAEADGRTIILAAFPRPVAPTDTPTTTASLGFQEHVGHAEMSGTFTASTPVVPTIREAVEKAIHELRIQAHADGGAGLVRWSPETLRASQSILSLCCAGVPSGEIDEPWAVYCPSSNHVQRCYATRELADAYCEDINLASRVKDWVVVDARAIVSDVRELNSPLPTPPAVTAVEDFDVRWLERQRDNHFGDRQPYEQDVARRILAALSAPQKETEGHICGRPFCPRCKEDQ